MADHQFICHQEIGGSFSGVYYVERIQIRLTTQSKEYTDMRLRDRSGSHTVRHWNKVTGIDRGDFVFIAANVEEYMGRLSIIAANVKKEDDPENIENYIPIYDDVDEHLERFEDLKTSLDKAEDKTPSVLVYEVYKSAKFFERFSESPGSERPHYGRIGGLVANIVRTTAAANYLACGAGLDDSEKAILIAAGLIFRVGAIDAYEFNDCLPVVTSRGMLLGVSTLTMTRVTAALRRVLGDRSAEDINQDSILRILHAINSYDGVAVKPQTREAIILHEAWNSDILVSESLEFMDADTNGKDGFTAWDSMTSRRYYVGEPEE